MERPGEMTLVYIAVLSAVMVTGVMNPLIIIDQSAPTALEQVGILDLNPKIMTIERMKELLDIHIKLKEDAQFEIYKNHTTIEVVRDFGYRLLELSTQIDTLKMVRRWCEEED